MNLYRLIYKLPGGLRKNTEKILDMFLCSKITAVIFFRSANFLFAAIRENKIAAGFINWIKRIGNLRKISMFNSSVKQK
jgi:hypothetical protein